MIEKIIENWLDKSSERSYQIPFCYLLVQQGLTIVHMTRHCGMEHGKDILALDKKGVVYAYQLKGVNGGKLGISEWQGGIQGQITQLAITPITHPSIKSSAHHRSYLVINGDIQEEVQHAIYAYNSDWESKGKPEYRIETIVKGEIVAWALKVKKTFVPSELQEFNSLLAFYLEEGTGFLDKNKFSSLLHSVLVKPYKNKSESRRIITSCALLCSLALSCFEDKKNHVSVIDGWTIYIAEIFWYSEIHNLEKKDYKNSIELADIIILTTLENLFEEVKSLKDLLLPNLAQDVFIYKHRLTILLGLISYLGYRNKHNPKSHSYFSEIDKFIQDNSKEIYLWGESSVPYLLNIYWFYKINNQEERSLQPLEAVLMTILRVNQDPNAMFTNVYLSAEDSATLIYDLKNSADEKNKFKSTSHSAQSIIHLCAENKMKQLLINVWPQISYFIYTEFGYENSSDFYLWRTKVGKDITNYEKKSQTWDELTKEASFVDVGLLPKKFLEFPVLTPLFLSVYPHRLRRNFTIWFDQNCSK